VLFVDLDSLGHVNDAFGHDAGDAVLREAANRLQACLRPGSASASCGGRIAADEFAFLVHGGMDRGHALALQMQAALASPLVVLARSGQRVEARLTCSVGLAAYPQHGGRPTLMAHAALAMRSVKLAGGNDRAEYDPRLSAAVRDQTELLQGLRSALALGQFELYYQPKVDARTLQITAAEALLRWHHPQRGLVSPAVFVPLAEQFGLIDAIGRWVIEEACGQAARWRDGGLRMRVAVNLSGVQLRQDDLVPRIEAALRRHRIPPGRLTCEITESVAMEDTQVTRAAFDALRRSGVHVSIDDFGTGHSSLAALRRLPAAELKIDRAFVCDLTTSEDARAIAGAIVQMAHNLGLRVVAEGVETEGQRDLLVGMGCDELQGYLFARPMTAQALALWAAEPEAQAAGGGASAFRASLFEETQPADWSN
jgi:diguanylate cyclase (GGDEF)-like protein